MNTKLHTIIKRRYIASYNLENKVSIQDFKPLKEIYKSRKYFFFNSFIGNQFSNSPNHPEDREKASRKVEFIIVLHLDIFNSLFVFMRNIIFHDTFAECIL